MRKPGLGTAVGVATLIGLTLSGLAGVARAQAPPLGIDDLISLRRPQAAVISPDGSQIACVTTAVDWNTNQFVTRLSLIDVRTGAERPLATTGRTNTAPAWMAGGGSLGFISDSDGQGPQVVRVHVASGERTVLTQSQTSVESFAWSPTGDRVVYLAPEPASSYRAEREKKYDRIVIADEDPPRSHLWLVDATGGGSAPRRLTSGPFSVGRFSWSPDGKRIAFDHKATSASAADTHESDLSIVNVADGTMDDLVVRPGPDASPLWSPDGKRIAFYTGSGNPRFNWNLNWTFSWISPDGGAITPMPTTVDELLIPAGWGREGLYFRSNHSAWAYLSRIDAVTGATVRLPPDGEWTMRASSFNADFSTMAFVASTKEFPEVYVARVGEAPRKLTRFGEQRRGWPAHTREMISWKSSDGTVIEGVLHKPKDFDPHKRYPLLVAIHGGPTSVSRPVPQDDTSYSPYPIDLWLSRGAVVMQPNYRGSLGRGEKFKSLLIGNLSVGEAADVISGIDSLVAQGIADKDRVGVMGWSYGGQLSSFLLTNYPDRVKAASVGAGVMDMRTNYGNTDLPDHGRHYNGGTPWDRPETYAKASAITNVKNAKAPTLIQHGEADPRVPPANARTLYRALQDLGVESRLVFFRGAGHILPTPKMLRAAMQQNYDWFNHHIFGDPLPASGTGAW